MRISLFDRGVQFQTVGFTEDQELEPSNARSAPVHDFPPVVPNDVPDGVEVVLVRVVLVLVRGKGSNGDDACLVSVAEG